MESTYVLAKFYGKTFAKEVAQIHPGLEDKIVSFGYTGGILTVEWAEALTSEEAASFQTFLQTHTGEPPAKLRIYRVVPETYSHHQIMYLVDFSILGFRKISPHVDRGRKASAEYMCVDKDEVVVDKVFTDIWHETEGWLHKIQGHFRWYDEDGNVALEKTEIVKEFTKDQAEDYLQHRRRKALNFLKSEARGTPIEPMMEALMTFYHDQVEAFVDDNSTKLAKAITEESNSLILGYLETRVPFTSNTAYTVPIKESILYQIGALDEAGLLATLQPAGGA